MTGKQYIGIDAGGTKTAATVGTADRFKAGTVDTFTFGPGNFREIGEKGVTNLARQIVDHFNISNPAHVRVIGGFAGAGDRVAYHQVTEAFSAAGFSSKNVTITNDASLLLAALQNKGIVLIAGTGGICMGRNGGIDIQSSDGVERAGGYGYRIGSEASGYYLGCRAIDVALKIEDGRKQAPSVLHERVRVGLGLASLKEKDIVPILYPTEENRGSVQALVAGLAPVVLDAAASGDAPAMEIVRDAVDHMADHIQSVAKRLGVNSPQVALYGGLFKGPHAQSLIIKPLCAHEDVRPYNPSFLSVGNSKGELDTLLEAVRFVIANEDPL